MSVPETSLPPSLRRIAQEAGMEAALRLAVAFGGTHVSVSTRSDNSVLKAIGPEAAATVLKLIRAGVIGDGLRHFEVPCVPMLRRQAIRDAVAAGRTKTAVARAFGMSTRSVRRICNERAGSEAAE